MSEDEDDYMSDKFLASLTDVRPSLVQDRAKKRALDVRKKQNEVIKKQKEARMNRTGENRNEKLQESLSKPLEADNKGFQMLAKMGYKTGQALGKNSDPSANGDQQKRLTEPIAISVKNDRGGLGRETALKEFNERRKALALKRFQEKAGIKEVLTTDEFRKRATQKAEERFTQGALRKCQMSCETLDTKEGLMEPEVVWFWPERPKENPKDDDVECNKNDSEDSEAEDEYTPAEKLEMLTSYLRTSYMFCYWCGVHYQNQEDLSTNCPGLTHDDH